MNVTITWNPGDTWRKLGYLYYTDSLQYRAVLEQNPQWSVMTEPPIGASLLLQVNEARQLSATGNPGFFVDTPDVNMQEKVFPFEYPDQYYAQAAKYSLYSIVNYNELNGYTMDTPEALTGNR